MKRQPTVEEIAVMTRKQMKRCCKTYKLSRKGKNEILIDRLTRYVEEHVPPPPVEEEIPEEPPSPFELLSPFDQALLTFNAGKWELSQGLYDQCLDTWHESDELWVGKGNAQYQLNDHTDSLLSYEKALELNENSLLARRNKVNILIGSGRFEDAYKICDELAIMEAVEEWVWLRMAYICIATGKPEEALDHLQKILEIDDNLEEIWNLKGTLLVEKDSEAALRCFNKALELRDDYAAALCNKASALTRLGMVDDAKRHFTKALKIDNRAEFWNCRGVLHMGLDENLKALACFGKAIEVDPGHAEAWNNRGTVLKGMKKLGEALDCFHNALELSPGFEDARTSLDEVHQQLQVVEEDESTPIEDFLVSVPGIGSKKAKVIIEAGFNSMESLRNASINSLSSVKGVGENLAHTIKEFLD
ncbi:MAG: tetratricopeptide repeat protein [Thermoplasmata archaeon]